MKPIWTRLLLMPLAVIGGGLGISCSTAALPGKHIEIAEVPVSIPKDVTVTIPWVASGDTKWREGKPLFSVEDPKLKMAGEGWIAATSEYLLMRVVSHDEVHMAPFKATPWTSDGIEVAIDARGDGSRGMAKDKDGVQGPDDAKFILALSTDGPVIMCTNSQNPDRKFPADTVAVRRDDQKKETVYDLRLKWDFLATPPGLYSTLGMTVQFNDLDPGDKDKRSLIWGGGTFGKFTPGLFQRLAVAPLQGECHAMAFGSNLLWDRKDAAEAVVAVVSGKGGITLRAKMGAEEAERVLPATKDLKRYQVTFRPEDRSQVAVPYRVALDRSGEPKPLAELSGNLEFPDATYAALIAKLDSLIAATEAGETPAPQWAGGTPAPQRAGETPAPQWAGEMPAPQRAGETPAPQKSQGGEALFRLHLNSVRSLAMSEWARVALYRDSSPQAADDVHKAIKKMLAGLEGDAGKWQTYVDGKRNLIFAYVSPKDHSVQYYECALPKDWDPEKAYPLFFELHGAGNDNPLIGISGQISAIEENSPLAGYGTPRSYAAMQRAGYYCEPFGRGNLGYRGIGETDVWEAYDDVHRRFKIDENRQYLFGFSMGGGGTWSIGVRTPDRWAAMAIMAGGMWRESAKLDLGGNLSYVPVFIWAGEKDSLFPNVAIFKEQIERHGGKLVVRSTPNLAHDYTGEIQKESIEWLQQFTRKRPDAFSFTADTDEHTGVWGVTMVRDLTVSGLPHFDCKIEGQTVRIDSKGTPGLRVVPGEGGLGLKGDIAIAWNGKKVYEGSAQEIPGKKKDDKPGKEVKIGEVPDGRGRR